MIQSPHFGRPPGGFFVCARQRRQGRAGRAGHSEKPPRMRVASGAALVQENGAWLLCVLLPPKTAHTYDSKKRHFFLVCFSLLSVYVGTECSQETCKPGNRMGGLRPPKKEKPRRGSPGTPHCISYSMPKKGPAPGLSCYTDPCPLTSTTFICVSN